MMAKHAVCKDIRGLSGCNRICRNDGEWAATAIALYAVKNADNSSCRLTNLDLTDAPDRGEGQWFSDQMPDPMGQSCLQRKLVLDRVFSVKRRQIRTPNLLRDVCRADDCGCCGIGCHQTRAERIERRSPARSHVPGSLAPCDPEIAVRRPRHDPVSRLTASIFGQAMTGSIDCLALAPIRSGGSRIGSCGAQTSRDVSSWSSGKPSNRCPWLPSLPLMVR